MTHSQWRRIDDWDAIDLAALTISCLTLSCEKDISVIDHNQRVRRPTTKASYIDGLAFGASYYLIGRHYSYCI